ncbi:MAG: right-handed parallel beta-helix repeat-containing protein [Solirubrobacteraceae bacterium]
MRNAPATPPRPLTRKAFLLLAGGGALAAGGLGCGTARRALSEDSPKPRFDVRDFGAKGDGVTNDTGPFQRAASALNAAGGGTLSIPPGTYVVGRQGPIAGARGRGFSYSPEEILYVHDCRNPVEIRGDGATLKAQGGLRFGAFDPLTGEPHEPLALPFTDYDYRADAYRGMVRLERNTAVLVNGLELDGNIDELRVGGPWGDAGRQCAATGILSYANDRLEVEQVNTHHHGLDGLTLGHTGLTVNSPETPVELTRVRCEHNARQGLSYVGGIALTATDCSFSHTGQGPFASPPGAGVDIEPEDSVVRNARFRRCRFVNNSGSGFIADSGDSADIELRDCLVHGSQRGPAVWPRKPAIRFESCKIYGWVVNAYGSPDVHQATRFVRCEFEDQEHPDYGRPFTGAALIEVNGDNVSLVDCSITANATRSLYVDTLSREVIRGCHILHRNDTLAPGDFQALVRGSALEHTSFAGAFARTPAMPYFVSNDSVNLGAGVRVEGEGLTWGLNGKTGLIAGP